MYITERSPVFRALLVDGDVEVLFLALELAVGGIGQHVDADRLCAGDLGSDLGRELSVAAGRDFPITRQIARTDLPSAAAAARRQRTCGSRIRFRRVDAAGRERPARRRTTPGDSDRAARSSCSGRSSNTFCISSRKPASKLFGPVVARAGGVGGRTGGFGKDEPAAVEIVAEQFGLCVVNLWSLAAVDEQHGRLEQVFRRGHARDRPLATRARSENPSSISSRRRS